MTMARRESELYHLIFKSLASFLTTEVHELMSIYVAAKAAVCRQQRPPNL
jgi:hypothetical protein